MLPKTGPTCNQDWSSTRLLLCDGMLEWMMGNDVALLRVCRGCFILDTRMTLRKGSAILVVVCTTDSPIFMTGPHATCAKGATRLGGTSTRLRAPKQRRAAPTNG